MADGAALLVGERRHGKVRRQLRLSDSLDLGAIEARFDNGVLHVRVPVAETAQPHKVEISVGATPLVETAAVEASTADAPEDASDQLIPRVPPRGTPRRSAGARSTGPFLRRTGPVAAPGAGAGPDQARTIARMPSPIRNRPPKP